MKMNSKTLLRSKLQHVGEGVFEVVLLKPAIVVQEPLTNLERAELIRHHRSQNVNEARAQAVKTYYRRGATRREIIAYLKGGEGCGSRMIDSDLAALLAAKRKTR